MLVFFALHKCFIVLQHHKHLSLFDVGNLSMRVTEGTGTEASGGTISRFALNPGHPHSSASKLPVKTRTQLKSLSVSSGHTKPGETLDACPEAVHNALNSQPVVFTIFSILLDQCDLFCDLIY